MNSGQEWRRSTASGGPDSVDCVELNWRKAESSGLESCVEVVPGQVRDSKNPRVTMAIDVAALVAFARASRG